MPPAAIRVGSVARVRVEGRVARVAMEERSRHTGARAAESTYLYPLPGETVVEDFRLSMGRQ